MARSTKIGPLGRPVADARRRLLAGSFVSGIWSELKKVTWPSREETMRLTVIVISVSLFVGVILGGADYIFSRLVDLLF